jgi:hypothetical protein
MISPGAAARLPPARVAASAPNGITPTPSPRSILGSRATCFSNFLIAPSADRHQDNCQHPLRCALHTVEERGVRCARDHPTTPRWRVSSAPDSARLPHRQPAVVRSWFRPRLITEHSPLTRLVVTQHMRTQQPSRAIVERCHRPVLNCSRTHQTVNLIRGLLGSRPREAHFLPQDIAACANRFIVNTL